jgi:hypothetical protein
MKLKRRTDYEPLRQVSFANGICQKMYESAVSFTKLVVDCFVSIFVITNLVVVIWRSIWDMQDFYYSSNIHLNYWISIFISFFIIVLVKIKQLRFYRHATQNNLTDNDCRGLVGPIELKFYIWMFAFANINNWSILL